MDAIIGCDDDNGQVAVGQYLGMNGKHEAQCRE
jgi:hypothetical protein